MEKKYTKTEKFYESKERCVAEHTPSEGVNAEYWNNFSKNSGKKESSLIQYRSAVNRFINYIGKDVLKTTKEDLENYLATTKEGKTRENAKRYIQSFLVFTISSNMDKAKEITSSDTILSLIPDEYKMLIKVLMNK